MQATGRYGLTLTDALLMSVTVVSNGSSFIRGSNAIVHDCPNAPLKCCDENNQKNKDKEPR